MDATVEFPLNRRILGLFFASIQQGVRPGLLLLAGVVVVCCGGLFQLFPADLWRVALANDARQGEREVVRAESRALVRLPQPGMGLASYGVPSLVQQMVANQLSTPGVPRPIGWLLQLAGLSLHSVLLVVVSGCVGGMLCRGERCGFFSALLVAAERLQASLIALLIWLGMSLAVSMFWLMMAEAAEVLSFWPFLEGLVQACVGLGCGWAHLVLLLGLFLGQCAIGIERCDGSEGISRGISFVLSQPLNFLIEFLSLLLLVGGVMLVVSSGSGLANGLLTPAGRFASFTVLSSLQTVLFLAGFAGLYLQCRQRVHGGELRDLLPLPASGRA